MSKIIPLPNTQAGMRWIEIPNSVATGMTVLEAIAFELDLAGFEPRQIKQIELAFTEALANAVHHGNHDDPTKSILIEYRIDRTGFQLAIEDEGRGFSPGDVDDPTEPEQILRPGGRGLLLIRSLIEDVSFNSQGNRIEMRQSARVRYAA